MKANRTGSREETQSERNEQEYLGRADELDRDDLPEAAS